MRALLHDVVEDAGTSYAEIAERFGARVAEIVASCSEGKSLSWEERKWQIVEQLPGAPMAVKLAVCADKLNSLGDLRRELKAVADEDVAWYRFNREREQQERFFRSLAAAIESEVNQGLYPEIFAALAQEVRAVFWNLNKKRGLRDLSPADVWFKKYKNEIFEELLNHGTSRIIMLGATDPLEYKDAEPEEIPDMVYWSWLVSKPDSSVSEAEREWALEDSAGQGVLRRTVFEAVRCYREALEKEEL